MIRNGKKREKEIKPGNKETGVSMRQSKTEGINDSNRN